MPWGRTLSLLLGGLTVLGLVISLMPSALDAGPTYRSTALLPSVENGSSGGDPPGSSSSIVCPSAGPVYLGVEWDCVAILNVTEIALILVSIGIIAYVFKDSDQAELPGEAAEVPVTAEEWEAYREARRRGVAWQPPKGGNGGDER